MDTQVRRYKPDTSVRSEDIGDEHEKASDIADVEDTSDADAEEDADEEEASTADAAATPIHTCVSDLLRIHDPVRWYSKADVWRGSVDTALASDQRAVDALLRELEHEYKAEGFASRVESDWRCTGFNPLAALYGTPSPTCDRDVRPLDSTHKAAVLLPGGAKKARVGRLHSRAVQARDALWRAGFRRPTMLDYLSLEAVKQEAQRQADGGTAASTQENAPTATQASVVSALHRWYAARAFVRVVVLAADPAAPELSAGEKRTSVVTGFLRAMDALWNLVLVDPHWEGRPAAWAGPLPGQGGTAAASQLLVRGSCVVAISHAAPGARAGLKRGRDSSEDAIAEQARRRAVPRVFLA